MRVPPTVLIVCDGWGHRDDTDGNAIAAARTPVMDALQQRWPHTLLQASGTAVGLPEGQMGNSEVGHLTIGSGRVVPQPLLRISQAVESGEFFENEVLLTAVRDAQRRGATLHCIGMVSPGGVHSHMQHGLALAELARRCELDAVRYHVLTDGRDEPPRSGADYVAEFQRQLAKTGVGSIASVGGRYYGMDRDHHWERVERGYRVLTGDGPEFTGDVVEYIHAEYQAGRGDEFLEPARCANDALAAIRDGDCVIFWNFRPDRARQLSHALLDDPFQGFERAHWPQHLEFVQFTEYDRELAAAVAFPRQDLKATLCEVVSAAGLAQFHVAETEKYAHVTYFINGGREQPFPGERRELVPSPRIATYDLEPAMSAEGITRRVLECLDADDTALIVVNFANCDMVGHTGKYDATVAAVEVVDACLGRIVDACVEHRGVVVITADHGNAEEEVDMTTRSPMTAHTTNLVPLVVCGREASLGDGGGLRDVAPTVLSLMGLAVPGAMSGTSLLARSTVTPQASAGAHD